MAKLKKQELSTKSLNLWSIGQSTIKKKRHAYHNTQTDKMKSLLYIYLLSCHV